MDRRQSLKSLFGLSALSLTSAGSAWAKDMKTWLFLVRRSGFREAARCDRGGIRIYRRKDRQSHLRASQRWRHRARRGSPRELRPGESELPAVGRLLLEAHRPNGEGSAILRCRNTVSHWHLLAERGRTQNRRSKPRRAAEKRQAGADPHRDHCRLGVLPCRGVSPGLLQEKPDPLCLLSQRLRQGCTDR